MTMTGVVRDRAFLGIGTNATRDGKEPAPCRDGAQGVILEECHKHRLKGVVLAHDLGALGGFEVEGSVRGGDLVLLLRVQIGTGRRGSGASGGGGRAASRGDPFVAERGQRLHLLRDVLDAGQRVVSWEDGYQSCKPGGRIDGKHCLILEADQRVVSWEDGYQSCKPGSSIDGKHCLILDADARVVSYEDNYQTCKVGDVIDHANCLVLKDGQHVVSWEDAYQT